MTSDASTMSVRSGGATPRRRTLLVMNGDAVDVRTLPLIGQVSIGRASECEVHVDHPSISRRHAVLHLAEGGISLVDQGGANGTMLRGIRVPSNVPVELVPNEAFTLGALVFVVQDIRAVAPSGHADEPELAPSARDPVVLDPAMKRLYELAARVARGTISVLVVGETGTGKEVLGEYVHRVSPRAKQRLVRINCAALPESLIEKELFGHEKGAFTGATGEHQGLLESADGGTVVLDEIGEMPLAMQTKLLRVFEERAVWRVGATRARPVDVRFVASTNADLESAVADGRFRRDLYFRIAGAVLAIPPLRERRTEILAMATAFVADAAQRLGVAAPLLDESAIEALSAHDWPGNVRELRNVIERAVLVSEAGRIDSEVLGLQARRAAASTLQLSDELATIERDRILDALQRAGGNQTRAAKDLGMPLRTFVKRLEAYGVPRPRKK